jgi:hypothetical protein
MGKSAPQAAKGGKPKKTASGSSVIYRFLIMTIIYNL